VIRLASAADAGALARLQLRVAWASYEDIVDPKVLLRQSVEADEAAWLSRLEAGERRAWVWDQAGDIVGVAEAGHPTDADAPPDRGHIFYLDVAPEAQGAGVGSALLRAALDGLREAGCADVTLWTFAENERALRFYTAAGWTPDGATVEADGADWWAPSIRLRLALVSDVAAAVAPAAAPDAQAPQGWCVCGQKVPIADAEAVTLPNGKDGWQGHCPECGAPLFAIRRKAKA
jgi:ribosomal protein S18 acetylase RimI-like enzyme